MHLGPVVGRGERADVHALDEHRVVKLYHEGAPMAVAQLELNKARHVAETGLPVPDVYELVEVEGRHGIVYERVHGHDMIGLIVSKPWRLAHYARTLAEVHAAIHEKQVPAFERSNVKEGLAERIRSSTELRGTELAECVIDRMGQLAHEREPQLCHADFHPLNVMIGPDGPVVIDWVDCLMAPPTVDVARTVLMLRMVPWHIDPPFVRPVVRLFLNRFVSVYLSTYAMLRPLDLENVERWQLPLAAARLVERIEPEQEALVRLVKRLCGEDTYVKSAG